MRPSAGKPRASGSPTALTHGAAFVLAVGVALATAIGLVMLDRSSDETRRLQLVLSRLDSDANKLDALQAHAFADVLSGAGLDRGELVELRMVHHRMERDLDLVAREDSSLVDRYRLREPHDRFMQGIDEQIRLLAAGRTAAAEEVHETAILPWYAEFRRALSRANSEYGRTAGRRVTLLHLASVGLVLAALAFVGVLFWRINRALAARSEAEAEQGVLMAQNERLRDLDRMKDNFLASVSHELRTPLTSIQGYLDLVLEGEAGELSAEQQRFLDVVSRNADRLLNLVSDLLLMAQIEAGKFLLERAEVDLAAVVHDAVEAARSLAAAKEIDLTLEAETVPEMLADAGRLSQLADNLLSNAIKFTPDGGRVIVRLAHDAEIARLSVTDSGIGVPADEAPHLFDRFFRASTATERAIHGTGLGLSIAKAVVDAHDGAISVESKEGVGTTFRVELPLASVTTTGRELVAAG